MLLMTILSFVLVSLCCCDRYCDQKQLVRTTGLLAFTSRSQVIRKPRQELKQELEAAIMEEPCLASFLTQPRTLCPGRVLSVVG